MNVRDIATEVRSFTLEHLWAVAGVIAAFVLIVLANITAHHYERTALGLVGASPAPVVCSRTADVKVGKLRRDGK